MGAYIMTMTAIPAFTSNRSVSGPRNRIAEMSIVERSECPVTYFETDQFQGVAQARWLNWVINELERLEALPRGWDTYGANPPENG